MKPLLEASNLKKQFHSTLALDKVSLYVNPGECLALLGPNGAGKTTTVEILEGLQECDSGWVKIFSEQLKKKNKSALMSDIGVMLQETNLYKKMTVRETLELFRSFFNKGLSVDEAIATVQLQDKANERLENLSGGQKQRAYLACAIINEPRLLFLDEPTTGLDPQSRRMIWDLLEKEKSRGRGILLTTHYMDEAEYLADRVAVIDHGKIIAEGTPEQLIEEHCGKQILSFSLEKHSPESIIALKEKLNWLEDLKENDGRCEVVAEDLVNSIKDLSQATESLDFKLNKVEMRRSTLEDVFLTLTGRSIRDA